MFDDVTLFMLVLGRMAGVLSVIPFLGGKGVPVKVKVLLILTFTLLLFPVLKLQAPQLPKDIISLFLLVGRETLLGLFLGMLSNIVFVAVEFCGQIVGTQMGFSMAGIFNPILDTQPSTIGSFQNLLAMLLFLSLGAHHLFLRALVESYQQLPLGAWIINDKLVYFFINSTAAIFTLGVKLAAPVMVSLLVTGIVLGIVGRFFPQMNIFIVSMPLNIGVGFIMLGLTLKVFLRMLENFFAGSGLQIKSLISLLT